MKLSLSYVEFLVCIFFFSKRDCRLLHWIFSYEKSQLPTDGVSYWNATKVLYHAFLNRKTFILPLALQILEKKREKQTPISCVIHPSLFLNFRKVNTTLLVAIPSSLTPKFYLKTRQFPKIWTIVGFCLQVCGSRTSTKKESAWLFPLFSMISHVTE